MLAVVEAQAVEQVPDQVEQAAVGVELVQAVPIHLVPDPMVAKESLGVVKELSSQVQFETGPVAAWGQAVSELVAARAQVALPAPVVALVQAELPQEVAQGLTVAGRDRAVVAYRQVVEQV